MIEIRKEKRKNKRDNKEDQKIRKAIGKLSFVKPEFGVSEEDVRVEKAL